MNGVERYGWGVVRVVAGRFKGKLAFYDDDDGDFAIIYVDGARPCIDEYSRVRLSSLQQVTEAEADEYRRRVWGSDS